ncbi:MAG: hypothetical protein K2Y08_04170 [Alphaproteobacteria bacterium]|nr:hypothetical protein [Alphaproteobacteria bacterium]
MCNFLKILKKTVVITLFITSSVLAMSDSEKERLQEEELLILRTTILTMEDLAEEERESLMQQIQNLENELRINKLPTPTRSSSAPVTSSPSSRYNVENELMSLLAMKNMGVKDKKVDEKIELLKAAQREGIKKYRSEESLRRLVTLFSKDPPR